MELKLYVGNLSFTTTEEEIRTLFTQAGTVTSVDLIKDRYTGNSKGFAFVQMSTQSEAEKAISMFNGYTFDNREIKVSPARPREESKGGRYNKSKSGSYNHGGQGKQNNRDRRGGSGRY